MSDIEIHHSDALVFLGGLDNGVVDLAVIDPPYGMGKADWDTFESHEAFLHFTWDWLGALSPKMKQSSSIYLFNTPFNCAYILPFLVGIGWDFKNWIVWNKQDGISAPKTKFVNGQEAILFFTRGKPVFNYDDVRIPYKTPPRPKTGILKNGKRWYPNPNGRLCPDVWDFSSARHNQKVNGKTVKMKHITPKPMAMIERMIKASSNEGDLVLDCFLGSGTTAIACKNLGRKFVGCEANEEYYKVSLASVKDGVDKIPENDGLLL